MRGDARALGCAALDPDDPAVRAALARLRRDCVEAKEALSFDTEAMIPVALPGLHTRVRLTRAEFEAMIAPALRDTVGGHAPGAALGRVERRPQLRGGAARRRLVADPAGRADGVGELERPVVVDEQAGAGDRLGRGPAERPSAGAVADAPRLAGRRQGRARRRRPRP